MNRRNLLAGIGGILASGFAPAAIGSGVLMPVRRIQVPKYYEFTMNDGRRWYSFTASSPFVVVPCPEPGGFGEITFEGIPVY